MRIYTHEELINKTMNELKEIKKLKNEELIKVRDKKSIIIGNIVALQGLIKIED